MKSLASWFLLAWLCWLPSSEAIAWQESQTLRIDSLDVAQPERTLQTVRIRIQNVTAQPQQGFVWYVLASPDEPEPWRHHSYASSERSFQLRPGRTLTVEFSGPNDAALDGRFALSVWVHGVRPGGERFHSDMRANPSPIVIAPPFSLSVDSLVSHSPDEDGAAMSVLVRFSVRNNQPGKARIGLDYRITPAGEQPAPDMARITRTAEIESGVDYIVTVRHEPALPRETLSLTAWIYELIDGQFFYRGKDVTPIEPRD